MSHLHDAPSGTPQRPNWSRINQWLLWLGLAAAVGWLFFRHNEHLLPLLPFLILLACPLMHLFGHGGHGGHRDTNERPPGSPSPDDERPGRGAGHVH